jgi:hypothetical protein
LAARSGVIEPTGGTQMPTHFDHLTMVVRDIDRAKTFFALLGFKEAISEIITC